MLAGVPKASFAETGEVDHVRSSHTVAVPLNSSRRLVIRAAATSRACRSDCEVWKFVDTGVVPSRAVSRTVPPAVCPTRIDAE